VLADLRRLSLSLGTATVLASWAPSFASASPATTADTGSLTAPVPAETTAEATSEHAQADDAPADEAPSEEAPAEGAPAETTTPAPLLSDGHANACLTQTICAVKEKIRWQTPAWTPSQCRRIADAVATSAQRHELNPSLLLAVMVNESDMNEKTARVYTRNGKVYAKDGGLMGIRCILGEHDRCTNGHVRGIAWKNLMDPVKNIELGARELARWRDGGAVMTKTIIKLDASGHRYTVNREVPCDHKTHAWWAHYNHGPRYIAKGYARHYPHRVAVLDHALATVMNTPAPELTAGRITIHDPGRRDRTIDHPLEPRYKKLYSQIMSGGTCSALALN
jgi:hypothetical protein